MDKKADKDTQLSKFLSLILRHKPETIDITLDSHGWADVEELILKVNQTGHYTLDKALLEEIVRTDNKQRYALSEDHSRIRANQGHSIQVDVELEEKIPPDILYHGTGEKSVASILEQGLLPQSRLYVHLSPTSEIARQVGSRHGKPAVFQVDAGKMSVDGIPFYLSKNGVWLVKEVPPKYLTRLQ